MLLWNSSVVLLETCMNTILIATVTTFSADTESTLVSGTKIEQCMYVKLQEWS